MPPVQLCGTLRESQREIAATITEECGLPLYSLTSAAIPGDRTYRTPIFGDAVAALVCPFPLFITGGGK